MLNDGAQVLLAGFAGDTAVHINCAEAATVDLHGLHVALTREFTGNNRERLVDGLCDEAFRWPVDDNSVETYDPGRSGWPGQSQPSLGVEVLGWVIALAIVGAVGALFLWLVGVL